MMVYNTSYSLVHMQEAYVDLGIEVVQEEALELGLQHEGFDNMLLGTILDIV